MNQPHAAPPVTVITGGSSGVGYELAALFAKDGSHVVLIARDAERLRSAAQALQQVAVAKVTPLLHDLSRPQAPSDIAAELHGLGLRPSVLVNNAGFGVAGPFTRTDLTLELAMIHVHVIALTHLTKLLLPDLIASGRGQILNLASTASFVPGPLMAVYFATKAYVLSFSEALANELRDVGVSVTALCPGPMPTNFQRRAGIGLSPLTRRQLMTPQAVARIGYRALLQRKTIVIPGWRNRLGVLAIRALPRHTVTRLSHAVQASRKSASEVRLPDPPLSAPGGTVAP